MAKEYKKLSDEEYAKLYDDEGLLSSLGGAGKAKQAEIEGYEEQAKRSSQYAKDWLAANREIMDIPVNKIIPKKEYDRIIDKYINDPIDTLY